MHYLSMIRSRLAPVLVLALAATLTCTAHVRLPNVFSHHMVLQRDCPLTFWGWAEPGESVTITIGANSAKAQANPEGEWKLALPPMSAGGPHTVVISGANKIELQDVLVGEVWLCSGQSNMEQGVGVSKDAKAEIAAANHPLIRLLMVPNRWTPLPQTNIDAAWKVCTPESIAEGGWGGFSAAAYSFARELRQKLNVPVGLIDATWGGTRIESWTAPQGFGEVPALAKDYQRVQSGDPSSPVHQARLQGFLGEVEKWLAATRAAATRRDLVPPMPSFPEELHPPRELQQPTALFNGMIHPLCPFPIRGAIWYQGESNSGEGMLYTERMKALIEGWRKIWGLGPFPFYYVQIAPFNYGGRPEVIGEFWEAQAAAQAIPNTGMAVINDIGDLKDIHPANKQDVGRRLAWLALNRTYGHKDVICSGPVFNGFEVRGQTLRLSFKETGAGLRSRDGQPLSWFEMIDADQGGFVKAKAEIEGTSTVVLSAPEVKKPVAVRFAWSMLAEPNLANSAGLPASAFRAGSVPKRDALVLHVPEAAAYKLVYDLDLAKLGSQFSYDLDQRSTITTPFDRIAYFVELQNADGVSHYLYASMDAFTDSLDKIGIPTAAAGFRWQRAVSNLTVISDVAGLRTGTGLTGGWIEFWPHNYGQRNAAKVPNASDATYDFGDEPGDPLDGYGCMQLHNAEARQTLFAINNWKAGAGADLGIGNQPSGNPDWTFAANAGKLAAKRLRILVRPAAPR
jgi:sialate O-acetylesterase